MAVQGPFKVEFGDVFPFGADVRRVAAKRDYNASTRDNPVQAKDKDTGMLMWVVTVIDRDPDSVAGEVRVNVAAKHQPVPPEPLPGTPYSPVEFVGLRVMPYVEQKGDRSRLAFSLRADALQAPLGNGKTTRKEAA